MKGLSSRLMLGAVVLVAAHALPARAQVTIALRPGMDALPVPGVPLLWADVPDADVKATDLTLTPEHAYTWIAEPGQGFTVTAASAKADARVVLTVWDWDNHPVAQRKLPGAGKQELRFDVAGRGTYLLTLDRFVGDTCEARLARSFAVCPSNMGKRDLWRQGAFWPGACSFPGRQNWTNSFGPGHPPGLTEQQTREMDADLSARLGLVLVRPDLPVFWPAPDKPMDFALADAALGAFTSRGFKLALQVGLPDGDWAMLPQYKAATDPHWRYPRAEDATRKYARAVVARYGKDAAFVEVYNEPDNLDFWRGTVEEFVASHHWVAAEAKQAAPGVPIISGGLCLMDPERTGLIARGIVDAVDGVGYHSHGGVDVLQASLTAMRALHAAAGYKSPTFYNTEMGFANWRLDMERASAATAVQKLLYCWAHGNRAALLYCSRDIGGPRMSAQDWGFLDFFFCPRCTYGAVAAFMDTYAGATFDRVLTEANGLYVYAFRSGGKTLVTAFVGSDYPRPIVLETDAQGASLLDPMGNAADVKMAGGRVSLTAGYAPTTLVLEKATKLNLAGG
jgi:hypothetical protein